MIEFDRWVASPDMAKWLSSGPELSLEQQVAVICAAPHRNVQEKLAGLECLIGAAGKEEEYKDRLETWRCIAHKSSDTIGRHRYLYEGEIFRHGISVQLQNKRLFRRPWSALNHMKQEIREAAACNADRPEDYCGILYEFWQAATQEMHNVRNLIVNGEGEILYCIPEFTGKNQDRASGHPGFLEAGENNFMKVPYESGTVVELRENPFFYSVRGVLVNEAEPEDADFGEENHNQWLLYPDRRHPCGRISFVSLVGDHAAFRFDAQFPVPFRQFIRRREEDLPESERWLEDLGRFFKMNKGHGFELLNEVWTKRRLPCEEAVRELYRSLQGNG